MLPSGSNERRGNVSGNENLRSTEKRREGEIDRDELKGLSAYIVKQGADCMQRERERERERERARASIETHR